MIKTQCLGKLFDCFETGGEDFVHTAYVDTRPKSPLMPRHPCRHCLLSRLSTSRPSTTDPCLVPGQDSRNYPGPGVHSVDKPTRDVVWLLKTPESLRQKVVLFVRRRPTPSPETPGLRKGESPRHRHGPSTSTQRTTKTSSTLPSGVDRKRRGDIKDGNFPDMDGGRGGPRGVYQGL